MSLLFSAAEAAGYSLQLFFVKDIARPTPISRETFFARLANLQALIHSSEPTLLIVAAWALLEAATRKRSPGASAALLPATVVKTLQSLGSVSQPQAERLSHLLRIRNAAAHGFESPAPNPDDLELIINIAQSTYNHTDQ